MTGRFVRSPYRPCSHCGDGHLLCERELTGLLYLARFRYLRLRSAWPRPELRTEDQRLTLVQCINIIGYFEAVLAGRVPVPGRGSIPQVMALVKR